MGSPDGEPDGSPLQMHFYAIMKRNGWIIVQSTLKL